VLSRRSFLRNGLVGAGALSFGTTFWRNALAAGPTTRVGVGPYGALQAPDANGMMLPPGFTSRVIARANLPVGATGYVFPIFPDGSATYEAPDGGWILAVNSEVPAVGGASGIRFDKDGAVTSAYRILDKTSTNCAGGPTPWGTWLSCEEVDAGLVWECDPTGAKPAMARPALGAFKHEAACVDPAREQLYLSEDQGDGGLYRFTPDSYPDLSKGVLEVAAAGESGKVVWKTVPDPAGAAAPTRKQVPEMIRFKRGEGIWFDSGLVYLATTSDETIHTYDTATQTLEVLYRADDVADAPLRGVDNIHVSRSGDLFVAEDSYTNDPDAMDVCLITPDREVSRFLKLTGPEHFLPEPGQSETVGLTFDPSGKRLYFGSQRGAGFGIVYEVTGPFRQSRPVDPMPGAPIGLAVPKELRLRRFACKGLPVALTLDSTATVRLALRDKVSGKSRLLAREVRELGPGPETITLKPTPTLRKQLVKRRKGLRAKLELRIAAPGAPERVVRRTVRLTPTPRPR
jgi:uncharacterized protein